MNLRSFRQVWAPRVICEMMAELISSKTGMKVRIESISNSKKHLVVEWLDLEVFREESFDQPLVIEVTIVPGSISAAIECGELDKAPFKSAIRLKDAVSGVKSALGWFFPEFLFYDSSDATRLGITQNQLVSINRLILRWKRVPDTMSKSADTIVVSYGSLCHQIESDGHCHT